MTSYILSWFYFSIAFYIRAGVQCLRNLGTGFRKRPMELVLTPDSESWPLLNVKFKPTLLCAPACTRKHSLHNSSLSKRLQKFSLPNALLSVPTHMNVDLGWQVRFFLHCPFLPLPHVQFDSRPHAPPHRARFPSSPTHPQVSESLLVDK